MKGRVKNGTFFMHPFYLFEIKLNTNTNKLTILNKIKK